MSLDRFKKLAHAYHTSRQTGAIFGGRIKNHIKVHCSPSTSCPGSDWFRAVLKENRASFPVANFEILSKESNQSKGWYPRHSTNIVRRTSKNRKAYVRTYSLSRRKGSKTTNDNQNTALFFVLFDHMNGFKTE